MRPYNAATMTKRLEVLPAAAAEKLHRASLAECTTRLEREAERRETALLETLTVSLAAAAEQAEAQHAELKEMLAERPAAMPAQKKLVRVLASFERDQAGRIKSPIEFTIVS